MSMRCLRFIFLAVMALWTSFVAAEILHDVGPLDSLGDIKKKYPNATLQVVKAAWVTESEGFYSLEGNGFPGKLYLAFRDSRGYWRNVASKADASASAGDSAASAPWATRMAALSEDDALNIKWVRWVPASPLPLERYKSKYGEPAKCDFLSDSMSPFCSWPARDLVVNLSDDRKFVLSAEASFTQAEQRAAWLAKYGYVPDSLADTKPSASSNPALRKPEPKKASVPKN